MGTYYTFYLWKNWMNMTQNTAGLAYYNGTTSIDISCINDTNVKNITEAKIAATRTGNVYIYSVDEIWKVSLSPSVTCTRLNVTLNAPMNRTGPALVGYLEGFFLSGGKMDMQTYSDLWYFDGTMLANPWSLRNSMVVTAESHTAVISILPPTTSTQNVTLYFTNLGRNDVYMVSYDYSNNATFNHYNNVSMGTYPLNRIGTVSSVIGNSFFYFYGLNMASMTLYNDYFRFIDEKYCTTIKDCEVCVGIYECGWCNSALLNGPSCVAGNSSMVGTTRSPTLPQTCGNGAILLGGIENCPELFPSWAIALIVIGGVILVGGIVFGIMKLRSGKPGYDPV
jgi:hypothetical protein